MSLSTTARHSLQTLQSYYHHLYFVRWFLPANLKDHLNRLDHTNLSICSDDHVASIVVGLYQSLGHPNWYRKLILYFFSNLNVFMRSELMISIRNLETYHLLNQDNTTILLEYEQFQSGVDGLLLLRQATATPLSLGDGKAILVSRLLRLQQLNLPNELQLAFMKKTVERRQEYIDFSKVVQVVIGQPMLDEYIPMLLDARSPEGFASILLLLKRLPTCASIQDESALYFSSEQKLADLKHRILHMLHPLEFVRLHLLCQAIKTLILNNQLESLTFDVLFDSRQPIALANLIKEFEVSLDQQKLAELDNHLNNLIEINKLNLALSPSRRTHIPYCRNLINLVREVGQSAIESGIHQLYDAHYDAFYPNQHALYDACGLNTECLRALALLNRALMSDRLNVQSFLDDILMPVAKLPDFVVILPFVPIFLQNPDWMTVENRHEVLKQIKSCVKKNELLQRCTTLAPDALLSLEILQGWVIQLNATAVRAHPLSRAGVSKIRQDMKCTTSPVVDVSGHEQDLECGVLKRKSPSVSTPYSEAQAMQPATSNWGGILYGMWSSVVSKPPAPDPDTKTDLSLHAV